MRPNKYRYKYFGNLYITYKGEIMEITETANKYLREMNTRIKDMEMKKSKMVTFGLIHRYSPDWDLPFWYKIIEEETNKARTRYQKAF